MPSNSDYKKFLQSEMPERLSKLTTNTPAQFGLMSPQHMVEHLILMTKISVKQYGDVNAEPSEGQIKFKKFIDDGAKFEHRPSKKTVADLPDLKYGSLEEALGNYPQGINGFYTHFESNPEFKAYNNIQGALGFEDLELLHRQHFEYHLGQFGL